MILNSAPLNAAPIGGLAIAGASGGGSTTVNVAPEASGMVPDGSTRIIEVSLQSYVTLASDQTAVVTITTTGGGASNMAASGTTAIISVSTETGPLYKEIAQGGFTAEIEILQYGHWGRIYQGSFSEVLIRPEARGRARDGSITDIWVLSSTFGRPSTQNTAQIDIASLAGSLIGASSEAGIAVDPSGFAYPLAGSQSTIEVASSALARAQVTGNYEATINVTAESLGIPAASAVASVSVSVESGALIPGASLSAIEVGAAAGGQVVGHSQSGVSVEVLTKGIVTDGSKTEVLVSTDSGGFIFSKSPAPESRTFQIRPKRRVLIFSGDDKGSSMKEYQKQPSEVVDYDIGMDDWFAENGDDDYISRVDYIVVDPPGELEIGSNGTPTTVLLGTPPRKVKVWVSGGLDGREYKVTLRARTNIGRVEEIDFLVLVEEQ